MSGFLESDDDDELEQAISLSLQPQQPMGIFTSSTIDIQDSSRKDFLKIQIKWKTGIEFAVDIHPERTTVGMIKEFLEKSTGVLKKNQKLIGLAKIGKPLDDNSSIASLGCKVAAGVIKISLIGSTESEIESVSVVPTGGRIVINDLALSVSQNTREWSRFQEISQKTEFNVINQPRAGKKLLVLDLDHTILHFTSKGEVANESMKRPFMDVFLSIVYNFYDIVFWSQTSWRWIEIKLTELGMVTNPGYKICFVLDKTSMFSSTDGKLKPLSIIWNNFKHWNSSNSLHVDDLERNFQLNKSCGITIPPYNREKIEKDKAAGGVGGGGSLSSSESTLNKKSEDIELLILARYLVEVSDLPGTADTDSNYHKLWRENTCSKLVAELPLSAPSLSSSSSASSQQGSSSSLSSSKQHFFDMIISILKNIE